MKHLTPQVIAEITDGNFVGEECSRDMRVVGAVRDNREVKPGNLFVCIQGKRADGHSFANSAFRSGAVCCLTERILPDATGPYVVVESTLEAIKAIGSYHRNLFKIPVIGITGSVGKTTAKELIAATLGTKLRVLKTQGNLNNELGVPLTLLSLNEQHEAAVIEMGISDFGEMSSLAQMVRPDYFVITKIGYAHLEALGDLHGVLRAKTEAFSYMNSDGFAILNGDDELLWRYNPGIQRIMYGAKERNDIRVADAHAEGTGTTMCSLDIAKWLSRITYTAQEPHSFHVKIHAYGDHIAEMTGAAAAAGLLLGLNNREIAQGLLSYKPVDGRANVSETGNLTIIDDCYNANPNSTMAALTSLSKLQGHRIAILGDMMELGERSDELHREVGAFAAKCGINSLVCCGEKAAHIQNGFNATEDETGTGSSATELTRESRYYPTKDKLIADLPALIKKDDIVLIKASNGMKFKEIAILVKSLPT